MSKLGDRIQVLQNLLSELSSNPSDELKKICGTALSEAVSLQQDYPREVFERIIVDLARFETELDIERFKQVIPITQQKLENLKKENEEFYALIDSLPKGERENALKYLKSAELFTISKDLLFGFDREAERIRGFDVYIRSFFMTIIRNIGKFRNWDSLTGALIIAYRVGFSSEELSESFVGIISILQNFDSKTDNECIEFISKIVSSKYKKYFFHERFFNTAYVNMLKWYFDFYKKFIEEFGLNKVTEKSIIDEFLKQLKSKRAGHLDDFFVGDFVRVKPTAPINLVEYAKTCGNIFRIYKIDLKGYFLASPFFEKKFPKPELGKDLELYPIDTRYKNVRFINQKGFLVVSSVVAYGQNKYTHNLTSAQIQEYSSLPEKGFLNLANSLEHYMKYGKFRFPISASSVHKDYFTRPAVLYGSNNCVGYVISAGKLQHAYLGDGATENITIYHRIATASHLASDPEVPIEVALRKKVNVTAYGDVVPNNELVISDAKVGGLFYVVSSIGDLRNTDKEFIDMMKNVCYDYKLDLYEIDDNTRTWQIFKWKDYHAEWEKQNIKFSAQKRAE